MIVQYGAIIYHRKEVRRMDVQQILAIVKAFFDALKNLLTTLGIKIEEKQAE